MVILGAISFYSISSPEVSELRSIKHTGTFVGLMGIGVVIAGLLLNLINRNEPIDNHNSAKEPNKPN